MNSRNSLGYIIVLITTAILILCVSRCTNSSTNSSSNNGVSFNSGIINPGGTFTYTFKNTGTYNYYCSIHKPDMKGEIIVSNSAQISGQDTVEMKNIQFVPNQVTVMPDTRIVWINKDNVNHTVVSGTPS